VASGSALFDFQNTTDAASNQLFILRSGNRATPTDNDEGYISLYNDDSAGAQTEFSRISWVALDVTNTTKDASITFDVMVNDTLTEKFSIGNQVSDVASITSAGEFSHTGGQANSEIFGEGASTTGDESVVMGQGATGGAAAGNGQNVVIGEDANSASQRNIVVGHGANQSGGESSVLMGFNTTGTTSNSIVVGASASTTAASTVVVGDSASVTAAEGTAIGRSSTAGQRGTALGDNADGSDADSVAIGNNSSSATRGIAIGSTSTGSVFQESIALGYGAENTANNQFVMGSNNNEITFAYIGEGVTNATPITSITLTTTGGNGTDIDATDLILAAGRPTGAGSGGELIFRTADAGAGGTTLRSLTTAMVIDEDQKVTIGGTIPIGRLDVDNLATTDDIFRALNNGTEVFVIEDTDHIDTNGTAPSLSSCGTSPSVTGNDMTGRVTIGTGTPTSCTVTFSTAYDDAPSCNVTGDAATTNYAASMSTTVLTITSNFDMSGDVVVYNCRQP